MIRIGLRMLSARIPHEEVNRFWFGRVEQTIVPSENRAKIWFGEDQLVDIEIQTRFGDQLRRAVIGECEVWQQSAHGQLALIIMLDQFSRHIHRDSALAFAHDRRALEICADGIAHKFDHELSLIERVFFYFPLLHSEHIQHQNESIRAYEMLTELAFMETKIIYESFLKFAHHHYSIIERFGRFPQRNAILQRESTPDELRYLEENRDL